MPPTSFNVGPSALWPELPIWASRIFASGVLTRSHRSPAFEGLYQRIQAGFEAQHGLPDGYRVWLLSSATECWQVLADALEGVPALHLYNGDFGARWYHLARAQHPETTTSLSFDLQAGPHLPEGLARSGFLALTHNETSNGSFIPHSLIEAARHAAPAALVAVDATSSFGGVALPYAQADLWFASVQKCLGLPAGLAVALASPRAQAWVESLPDNGRYNALKRIHSHSQHWQTTHTPNLLGIALLAEMLEHTPPLAALADHTAQVRAGWDAWLADETIAAHYQPLVNDAALRSSTVLALRPLSSSPTALLQAAEAAGFLLAKGYGPWKNETVRIANFPALPASAHAQLRDWLTANAAATR